MKRKEFDNLKEGDLVRTNGMFAEGLRGILCTVVRKDPPVSTHVALKPIDTIDAELLKKVRWGSISYQNIQLV